jgi:hypothetical protein
MRRLKMAATEGVQLSITVLRWALKSTACRTRRSTREDTVLVRGRHEDSRRLGYGWLVEMGGQGTNHGNGRTHPLTNDNCC